ncbi:hypothetical protein CEXT_473531 [Caerostris extrusa]|uniref:Uncharacterized protein n=1 Tax=Caerostris extrusa TaxID=172846 RepID=A0AAV4M4L4_CAEEX|nr:hypothetical protein CEXT_473531 [Caerostris extrusa]
MSPPGLDPEACGTNYQSASHLAIRLLRSIRRYRTENFRRNTEGGRNSTNGRRRRRKENKSLCQHVCRNPAPTTGFYGDPRASPSLSPGPHVEQEKEEEPSARVMSSHAVLLIGKLS